MNFSIPVRDFHLRHTMESGQYFRWTETDGVYEICYRERVFRVWQQRDRLWFNGTTGGFVRHFFSLDHDLPAIAEQIGRDPWIRQALDRYWGVRILRQDPWECTAAFISSIASNIPRIARSIEAMARELGPAIRGTALHAFPRPDAFTNETVLRRLGLGFRAPYLMHAARLADAGLLDDVAGQPLQDARENLMVIPGVAEKVADCVLLFAYGYPEAFPLDTWIRKVLLRCYFDGKRVSDRILRAFAATHFGRHAGYAQQYLYIWSRESWKEIEVAAEQADLRRRLADRMAQLGAPASDHERSPLPRE